MQILRWESTRCLDNARMRRLRRVPKQIDSARDTEQNARDGDLRSQSREAGASARRVVFISSNIKKLVHIHSCARTRGFISLEYGLPFLPLQLLALGALVKVPSKQVALQGHG